MCSHVIQFIFAISYSELVNETFQKLWFTPTPNHDKEAMTRKILNITDVVRICRVGKSDPLDMYFNTRLRSHYVPLTWIIVSQVAACRDSGYDWFEQLLQNVSFPSVVQGQFGFAFPMLSSAFRGSRRSGIVPWKVVSLKPKGVIEEQNTHQIHSVALSKVGSWHSDFLSWIEHSISPQRKCELE